MSRLVSVRPHRRRWPGSAQSTSFDFAACALAALDRAQQGERTERELPRDAAFACDPSGDLAGRFSAQPGVLVAGRRSAAPGAIVAGQHAGALVSRPRGVASS